MILVDDGVLEKSDGLTCVYARAMFSLQMQIGISNRRDLMKNDTLLGLHELITYGVKGAAAYGMHDL